MIFCAEIFAGIDPEGTEDRFLFSTEAFHTGGGGFPHNTPVYPRLLQPANFERSLASDKLLFGLTQTGYGECVLANKDGALDDLLSYSVDGREFRLWTPHGESALSYQAFPDGWGAVFCCSMQSITGDGDVLRIRLREKVSKLDTLVCPTFTGAGGAEGTAEMEGQAKPVVFGSPYNVSPVLLSPSYLTYMVSAGGNVSADHLKDSGSVVARALTAGVQEDDAAANFSALQGLSVPIGHYATHATSGTLKLGSPPVGQVTVDARSTDSSNPADVLLAIIEHSGIATSGVYIETNTADFAALASWASGVDSKVGVFVRDLSTKHSDLINQIATSIGAWVGRDRNGEIRCALVTDPADMTSVLTWYEDEFMYVKRVVTGDPGRGVPYGAIKQKYPRNWTQQQSGLAGVVPASVRKEVAEDFPLATTEVCEQLSSSPPATVPVTDQFLGAKDYVIESYGSGRRVTSVGALEATPPAPASQFAALLGVPRDLIEVQVPFRYSDHAVLELGCCVTIQYMRHGLSSGKQFMVVAIRYQLSGIPMTTLTLWG